MTLFSILFVVASLVTYLTIIGLVVSSISSGFRENLKLMPVVLIAMFISSIIFVLGVNMYGDAWMFTAMSFD